MELVTFVLIQKLDPLSPEVIRNSLGAVFDLEPIFMSSKEFKAFCDGLELEIVAAALSPKAQDFLDFDYKKNICFLFGSEAFGLSSFWLKNTRKHLKISMQENGPDSLNLSVSVALFCFEKKRQERKV